MYNQFDKKIDELSLDDVKSLQTKQVKEGFYVSTSLLPEPEVLVD
jgi:hypothetical protein